jgi:glycine N-methyltransferase
MAVIEEANWLTLVEDLELSGDGAGESASSGHTTDTNTSTKKQRQEYDALLCLGNSFAHLPDFNGDRRDIKY